MDAYVQDQHPIPGLDRRTRRAAAARRCEFIGTNTYVNTGNTIYVGGTTGAPNLELDNTSITGGTIVNAGGQFTALQGNLVGVTYVGPLDLTSGSDYLGNTSAAFLSFTGGTLDSQSVTLSAGFAAGPGHDRRTSSAPRLSLGGELADTGNTLGFDANTIVDITGSVYMPVGHLLNAGTINIAPGASLNLSDSGAASGPETSEPGTIAIDDGTFTSAALNAGQTVELGPDSTFTRQPFRSRQRCRVPGAQHAHPEPGHDVRRRGRGVGFRRRRHDRAHRISGRCLCVRIIYGNDGVTHIAIRRSRSATTANVD